VRKEEWLGWVRVGRWMAGKMLWKWEEARARGWLRETLISYQLIFVYD